MVNIKLSDTYVAGNPTIAANPRNFIFSLGSDKYIIPSQSRMSGSVDQAITNASPVQINLRPYETFGIENEGFQSLVNSAKGGGDVEVLNRILFYVGVGTLEVRQDNGSPMTASAILNYVAP